MPRHSVGITLAAALVPGVCAVTASGDVAGITIAPGSPTRKRWWRSWACLSVLILAAACVLALALRVRMGWGGRRGVSPPIHVVQVPSEPGPARGEALYAKVGLGGSDDPLRDLSEAMALMPLDPRPLLLAGDMSPDAPPFVAALPRTAHAGLTPLLGSGGASDWYEKAARAAPGSYPAQMRVAEVSASARRREALIGAAAAEPTSVLPILVLASDMARALPSDPRELQAARQRVLTLLESTEGLRPRCERPVLPAPHWAEVAINSPAPVPTGTAVSIFPEGDRERAFATEWVNPTPAESWGWREAWHEPFGEDVGDLVELLLTAAEDEARVGDVEVAKRALAAAERVAKQYASSRPASYRCFRRGVGLACSVAKRAEALYAAMGADERATEARLWKGRLAGWHGAESVPHWGQHYREDELLERALRVTGLTWPPEPEN